jgi:hypothetical protein
MRKLQHDVPKKTELGSECLWFGEFPERRFELAAQVLWRPKNFGRHFPVISKKSV